MQTQTITAKQIHEDFYGAEERLFVEAVGLATRPISNKSLVSRYNKIGFGSVKAVSDAKQLESKKAVSDNLIAAIEYFRVYYPNNKFITESEVKKLCDKYGLLLGDARNFTGDMPEKNLMDIEQFKLRKEDWKEKQDYLDNFAYFIPQGSSRIEDLGRMGEIRSQSRQMGRSRLEEAYRILYGQLQYPKYFSGIDPYATDKKKEVEKEQPPFKICAPKENFNTLGYEVKDGYRLVYDPIVLQPVSKNSIDGYLIITAWGDEASDEIVINQTNN